jgi:hypothetical protein
MDEKLSSAREEGYVAGVRSAALAQLRHALGELGYEGTEAEHAKWILEREQVVALLRRVCAEHGDNEWPNNLHLRDVLDKHLLRYLGIES